ncbi:MAG: EAL domain-containing protein [Rhodoglobus sp.]|nr:EAL domain-containing protein [Rhodoglobus sp.]
MQLTREGVADSLRGDQFFLAYQPIVHLETRSTVGLEALVRWMHPVDGELAPGIFIGEFERIGAVADLGVWVARRALHEASEWHRSAREAGRELFLSINVSGYELQQPDYSAALVVLCDDFAHRCQDLQVEVIESDFDMTGPEVRANLQALRREQIKVLVDDFGAGASDVKRVSSLDADGIKIDRSLIEGIETDAAAQDLLDGILALAASADMHVVAEGIETEAQLRVLIEHGCTYGQGFLFSRPVSAADVPDILFV